MVVYLNLQPMTQVSKKQVLLKDVATVYCKDQALQEACEGVIVKEITREREKRYVLQALDVIKKLEKEFEEIQIMNIGEVQFVVEYHKDESPPKVWKWLKISFVCLISFLGSAFAIITFNNDVSVEEVFRKIYELVMGKPSNGFTILEISYSLGLGVGIIGFFNHFAKWKINTDPTPIEVEMRLYEENIYKTVVDESERKETDVDVW